MEVPHDQIVQLLTLHPREMKMDMHVKGMPEHSWQSCLRNPRIRNESISFVCLVVVQSGLSITRILRCAKKEGCSADKPERKDAENGAHITKGPQVAWLYFCETP